MLFCFYKAHRREERSDRKRVSGGRGGGGLFALGISVQGLRNVGYVAPAKREEQPVIYKQVSTVVLSHNSGMSLYLSVCRCVCV